MMFSFFMHKFISGNSIASVMLETRFSRHGIEYPARTSPAATKRDGSSHYGLLHPGME